MESRSGTIPLKGHRNREGDTEKMNRNFKLVLQYDGTRYHGWERKKNLDTIQGKVEGVLNHLTEQPVNVIGAGRTDAGVHAQGMVANVHLETDWTTDALRAYLNRYLPEDIGVETVREVSPRFHARYNAVGKTYRYTCYDGPAKPVFQRRYVYRLEQSPDLAGMRQGAAYLLGQHDFRSFCGNPKMKKSTLRTLDVLEIQRHGNFVTFTLHGDGFLQHMVRIVVGTLLEVGFGRMSPEQLGDILAAKDRSCAGPTAPAAGLTLVQVDY